MEKFEYLLDLWGSIPRSVLIKWNDELYHRKYIGLIDSVDLEKCINSIGTEGIPKYKSISGKLVHLDVDVDSSYRKKVFRFASRILAEKLINAYEVKTNIFYHWWL